MSQRFCHSFPCVTSLTWKYHCGLGYNILMFMDEDSKAEKRQFSNVTKRNETVNKSGSQAVI